LALPAADRPYGPVADLYAQAGRADRAAAMLDQLRANDPTAKSPDLQPRITDLQGWIALASGNATEARRLFLASAKSPDGAPSGCQACVEFGLASAFDRGGEADSAIAHYERYLQLPLTRRLSQDADWLAQVQRRLGELYDAKHDNTNALKYYGAFVELWKSADPELQPIVATVKKRMAQLAGAENH
jgi:tetratricopeptide (TPR) repeat protein